MGWLGVPAPQPSSHDQGVWVVCVTLDQHIHVPLAVDQQVLSPVQVQTQSARDLLDGALHQLPDFLLVHGPAHGQ